MPPLFETILSAALSLVLLAVGAEMLVRGASSLALRLGISELAVGLTVVAFGTSAPELVVSLGAALRGVGDIAVGNVVGSNICNIALILGLAALVRPIRVQAKIFRLDVPLLLLVTFVLAALLLTVGVPRLAGGLLLAGVMGYTAVTLRMARTATGTAAPAPVAVPVPTAEAPGRGRKLIVDVALVAGGLLGLTQGGRLLVAAAVTMAEGLGVSQATIGLTVVAVGTSLPELATSLVAALRGQGDLAVGNVVGSNLFNILGILGVTALMEPLSLGGITGLDLGLMTVLTVALLPIMRSGYQVSRLEGGVLVAAYLGYLAWLVAA